MKKYIFVLAAAILVYSAFLSLAAVNAYQYEPSWFTSPAYDDVYFISSSREMYEFILLVNEGCDFSGKTVCLTESVTLLLASGTEKPFCGTFNGLGNTIYIRSGSKSALFSELDGAEILDLTVSTTGTVTLPQDDYGAPVAIISNNTLFDGVRVTGGFEFTSDTDGGEETEMYSGMFVGYAEATDFFNCVSDVISSGRFGAFAGAAALCTVENCFSGSAAPFIDMQECRFKNVLCTDELEEQGVLNYGAFAGADDAVTAMNAAAEKDPDYDRWLIERAKPYVHIHTVKKVDETPATCSEKGRITYICECGKTVLDSSLPTIPHVFGNEGTVFAPTCVAEGYTLHICDVCGQRIISDTVPKTDHVSELVGALEPTCVKRGYTGDLVCVVCGAVVEKGRTIKATGQHEWGNMEITKEPTADESGYVTLYCLNCSAKSVEEIPALGHIALEYVYFDTNQHRAECTCGEEYYYKNHNWDAGVSVKEPTADEEGEILYTCTVCKGTKKVTVAALGHDIKEWKPYDETYHAADCSCGEPHKEEHSYDGGADGRTRIEDGVLYKCTVYTCVVCGAQKTVEEMMETVEPGGENQAPTAAVVDTRMTVAIIAGFAILLAGGVIATAFIRKSDVK